MVVVQVAHRDDVNRRGLKAGGLECGDDPRPLVGADRPGLVVHPLADPGLDEDTPGRRLDEQAVQRLQEAVLLVDLVGDEAVPENPRHGTEQHPGVGSERAGLDERDARSAPEVARPVDRVVHAQTYSRGDTGSGAGASCTSASGAWSTRFRRRGLGTPA